MTKRDGQFDHSRDSQTQKTRWGRRSHGSFTERWRTTICGRRARFSVARAARSLAEHPAARRGRPRDPGLGPDRLLRSLPGCESRARSDLPAAAPARRCWASGRPARSEAWNGRGQRPALWSNSPARRLNGRRFRRHAWPVVGGQTVHQHDLSDPSIGAMVDRCGIPN